jgi:hypothetical protein
MSANLGPSNNVCDPIVGNALVRRLGTDGQLDPGHGTIAATRVAAPGPSGGRGGAEGARPAGRDAPVGPRRLAHRPTNPFRSFLLRIATPKSAAAVRAAQQALAQRRQAIEMKSAGR